MTENSVSENVELKDIFATLWRAKWLIVFLALFAASSAYLISNQITPVYRASTTLLIDQAPALQASDNSSISASQRLARTYAELLTKRPVIDETLARVGIDTSLESTGSSVQVRLLEDTQLIELSVQSSDPVLAADLANNIVEVFTEQNEALQAGRFAASKASLSSQLDAVSNQIQAHEVAITNLGSPRTVSRISELERLQSELAQFLASYSNLLQSFEEIRTAEASSISNVIQIERAEPPSRPISPRVMLNTLLAGAIGVLIAVGIVFLVQHLDDTIKTKEDVERTLAVPVLGTIPKTKELGKESQGDAVLAEEQYLATIEAFRSLRTNLELLGNPEMPSTILVASPGIDDGKTTVASNLAITIGSGEKKVVLVDADLRRPDVHGIFNVPNKLGLSDALIDNLDPQAVATSPDNHGFKLITSGSRVENPAELLSSTRFSEFLGELKAQFDLVIFDGPPFLANEVIVLAARLKSVLLVLQPGRTGEGMAKDIKKQLERARADLIGVVLNKAPKMDGYGYSYYGYYDDGRVLKQTNRETSESASDREDPQSSLSDQSESVPQPSVTDQTDPVVQPSISNGSEPDPQPVLADQTEPDPQPSLTHKTEPPPRRRQSVLEPYKERIDELLRESDQQPPEQQYTAKRIFQLVQEEGYTGSERTIQRYVKRKGTALQKP